MFCTLSTEIHKTELKLFQLQATATDGRAAIQAMWYYVLAKQLLGITGLFDIFDASYRKHLVVGCSYVT